jgi:hypothetical protein
MSEVILDMAPLVQASTGETYRAYVHGRERMDGTWEGWLEFVPTRGALPAIRTPRETTQPTRDALVYWASGLEPVYFEGALARARPVGSHAPISGGLSVIEQTVLDLFRLQRALRLRTQFILSTLLGHANADLVRAFEGLEQRWHLVTRYTDGGEDWLQLTASGAQRLGLTQTGDVVPQVVPHPPKNIP